MKRGPATALALMAGGCALVDRSRRRTAQRLRDSEQLQRSIVGALNEGIIVLDADGRTVATNEAASRLLGIPASEIMARRRPFDDVFLADGTPLEMSNSPGLEVLRTGVERGGVEMRIARPHGPERWITVTYRPLTAADGTVNGVVMSAADITERHTAERALRDSAFHDGLTGLPNRTRLERALASAIDGAMAGRGSIALLCMDLDDFKDVNDSFGHAVGDALLCQAAARLERQVHGDDLLARHGGDEFMVLVAGRADVAVVAEQVAARLIESFELPFVVQGSELHVSASVGYALCPDDATSSADLLKRADAAMYQAKRAGRRRVDRYSPAEDQALARLSLAAHLRRALDRDEVDVHYQPIAELDGGAVVAVEALARWPERDMGASETGALIRIAEESGLLQRIDDAVLRRALAQLRRWRGAGCDLPVSFNASPRQLEVDGYAVRLLGAIGDAGLQPADLWLEVTESAAFAGPHTGSGRASGGARPASAAKTLTVLHDAGMGIALDDFGSRFSALSRLRELPVDILKLDGIFVRDLPHSLTARAVAGAMLELARALGMRALAEGIETPAQRTWLREQGWTLGQGYLLGEPAPASELDALLCGPDAMATPRMPGAEGGVASQP